MSVIVQQELAEGHVGFEHLVSPAAIFECLDQSFITRRAGVTLAVASWSMAKQGMSAPILYSFRRCPYAMRARLAIASAGLRPEHREIVLRDKAPEFLAASPKGTVPVLVVGDLVIEESLDVMRWALAQNDPENLLALPAEADELIEHCDGSFKTALDRTKYVSRYVTDPDPDAERARAQPFVDLLGARLDKGPYLCGSDITLADLAIFPFIRQFAHIDRARFDMDASESLRKWLDQFLASDRFASIMYKYRKWHAGDPLLWFGDVQA